MAFVNYDSGVIVICISHLSFMDDKHFYTSVEYVKYCGITAAAILSRVQHWCNYNKEHNVKNRYYEGYWWSGFMSSKEFSNQLGISARTIETHLANLKADGILIMGNFNKKGMDRTGWYRVDELRDLSKCKYAKSVNGNTQIKEMDLRELGKAIPDSISESKSERPSGSTTDNTYINTKVEELIKKIPEHEIVLFKEGIKNNISNLHFVDLCFQLIDGGNLTSDCRNYLKDNVSKYKCGTKLKELIELI
jgi:hypothetical protein